MASSSGGWSARAIRTGPRAPSWPPTSCCPKATAAQVAAMFDGGRYRPQPLDEAEFARCARWKAIAAASGSARLGAAQRAGMGGAASNEAYGEGWGREIAAIETRRRSTSASTASRPRSKRRRQPCRGRHRDRADALRADGLRLKRRLSVVVGEAFQNGLIEIQDEGSQLVAALVDARPGMQIADYCAGAGGKTLAMAAGMNNKGRVVAMDVYECASSAPPSACAVPARTMSSAAPSDADNRKWLKRQAKRLRPRAGRRAVHRQRHLAAESRRPLDASARGPGRTGAQAG